MWLRKVKGLFHSRFNKLLIQARLVFWISDLVSLSHVKPATYVPLWEGRLTCLSALRSIFCSYCDYLWMTVHLITQAPCLLFLARFDQCRPLIEKFESRGWWEITLPSLLPLASPVVTEPPLVPVPIHQTVPTVTPNSARWPSDTQ